MTSVAEREFRAKQRILLRQKSIAYARGQSKTKLSKDEEGDDDSIQKKSVPPSLKLHPTNLSVRRHSAVPTRSISTIGSIPPVGSPSVAQQNLSALIAADKGVLEDRFTTPPRSDAGDPSKTVATIQPTTAKLNKEQQQSGTADRTSPSSSVTVDKRLTSPVLAMKQTPNQKKPTNQKKVEQPTNATAINLIPKPTATQTAVAKSSVNQTAVTKSAANQTTVAKSTANQSAVDEPEMDSKVGELTKRGVEVSKGSEEVRRSVEVSKGSEEVSPKSGEVNSTTVDGMRKQPSVLKRGSKEKLAINLPSSAVRKKWQNAVKTLRPASMPVQQQNDEESCGSNPSGSEFRAYARHRLCALPNNQQRVCTVCKELTGGKFDGGWLCSACRVSVHNSPQCFDVLSECKKAGSMTVVQQAICQTPDCKEPPAAPPAQRKISCPVVGAMNVSIDKSMPPPLEKLIESEEESAVPDDPESSTKNVKAGGNEPQISRRSSTASVLRNQWASRACSSDLSFVSIESFETCLASPITPVPHEPRLYVALRPHMSRFPEELKLDAGETVTVLENSDEMWWQGCKKSGETGLFRFENLLRLQCDEQPARLTQNLAITLHSGTQLRLCVDQIICAKVNDDRTTNLVDVRTEDGFSFRCPVCFLEFT